MAETNAGENAEVQFIEQDGQKFQADPEHEGQPLKDESGDPIPYEEKGDEGAETEFVEVEGKKFAADPENPEQPLKDKDGNPIPFEEDKGKTKPEPVKPGEPPVRDKRDFIIDRLRQSRDKAKKEAGDGTDDEIDSEDEERIVKVVEKRYGVKLNKIDETENERELDSFFSKPENAAFKEKEGQIRDWWKHPSRNHLPISTVAYEVMGASLMAAGAKKQQAADQEARKTGGGGHSARGTMPKKDAWDETPDEFEAHQQAVRSKSR